MPSIGNFIIGQSPVGEGLSTNSDALVALILAALTIPKPCDAQIRFADTNVGNGQIIDLELALDPPVAVGTFGVLMTDATHYAVTAPGGAAIGNGVVGEGFSAASIAFAVVPGAVPFVAGDAFTIQTSYPTICGLNFFNPRDWPATTDKYPMGKLSSPRETKTSLGPNGPQFNTVTVVRLTCSVTATPQKNDTGAGLAQAALAAIQRQVERAVINNFELFQVIQEMELVEIDNKVVDNGTAHTGELTMDFSLKFPQGPEDFAPPQISIITEIALYADLLNVADPNGTYQPPFDYVPTAAPRTIGPDGRVEGVATVAVDGGT